MKKKKQPVPEQPTVYESQDPDQYWPALQVYFAELFQQQKNVEEVKILPDILRTDLNAWSFKNHYLDRLKLALYGKDYRLEDGYYTFTRSDFEKEACNA